MRTIAYDVIGVNVFLPTLMRILPKKRGVKHPSYTTRFHLVSEQRKTGFGRARNERGGRGRKETLADKPLDFENLRSQRLIGSASRTILTCVDQRFVSY